MPVSSTQRSTFTQSGAQRAYGDGLPPTGLKHGMKSADVRQLQSVLVKLGFMTEAQVATGPGTFGPRTKAALEKLQGALGAKVTGEFTAETRTKLEKKLTPAPVAEPRPAPSGNTSQGTTPARTTGSSTVWTGTADGFERSIQNSAGQGVRPARTGIGSQGLTAAADQALGLMNWGTDPSGKPWTPETLAAALPNNPGLEALYKKALKQAGKALDLEYPVLAKFDSEGRLKGDPRKEKTGEARRTFEPLLSLALAARFGPPELAAKAQAKAVPVLMQWVETYKASGNPINETAFPQLFRSLELVQPFLTDAQKKETRQWLRSFIKVHNQVDLPGLCAVNNWYDWRLAIQGAAAQALGDDKALATVRTKLEKQISHSVRNDGSTFDFHHRDSFHYHLYTLQAWLTLATSAPEAFTPKARGELLKAIQFMKPYYEGKKTHIEFQDTQVAFDKARAANGEETYMPHPWNPAEANRVLQLARGIFPEIRDWTSGSTVTNDSLHNELLAVQLGLN
jgi:peptidoglycan hydrolase-like protein with peptidoglycan-binding domain